MKEKYSDPDTSWVKVELMRHQLGRLPGSGDTAPIDYELATRKMAQAIDAKDVSPFNAALVIAWLGKRLSESNK